MSRALAEVSFRDPAGFVYIQQGDLRRQVNLVYREHYDRLIASGLYQELVEARLLIPHEELDAESWDPTQAYKVIRPEPIAFISYPYEWCFSEYRDAALVILEVQRRALLCGMSLKDCSAYNLQFHRGRPVLIDTLSFEVHQEGRPWVGYRQFCQHFLAPMALMALRDHRLGRLGVTNIDGVPLDLAVKLLPARSWINWGLLLHLRLHERLQRSHNKPSTNQPAPSSRHGVSRHALLGLVDSLASTVRGLRWHPGRDGWASYEEDLPYTPAASDNKARIVRELIEKVRARTIWDLGANTGRFSRMAAETGATTIAFDFDPACIERAYLDARDRGEERLLPLILDLFNPSPPVGWMNRERSSIFDRGHPEMVMALALIHHLAFVGNQPMGNLADFFGRLAPWVLIEFVPESDPQVRLLSAQRAGVHHAYNREAFERCFTRHFQIEASEPVTDGGRTLYLMRHRGD